MVAAMLAGMAVLGAALRGVLALAGLRYPELLALEMAVTTSAGMAAKRAARNPHEHGRTGVTVMTIADRAAHELSGTTALVTGASRGFGRGIAAALSKAGARVTGVARDRGPLEELRAPPSFTTRPC